MRNLPGPAQRDWFATVLTFVFQVFAVCRERRPSVSLGVSRTHHHERKEGADEGVVSVQEVHWHRVHHSEGLTVQLLKHRECRLMKTSVEVPSREMMRPGWDWWRVIMYPQIFLGKWATVFIFLKWTWNDDMFLRYIFINSKGYSYSNMVHSSLIHTIKVLISKQFSIILNIFSN